MLSHEKRSGSDTFLKPSVAIDEDRKALCRPSKPGSHRVSHAGDTDLECGRGANDLGLGHVAWSDRQGESRLSPPSVMAAISRRPRLAS